MSSARAGRARASGRASNSSPGIGRCVVQPAGASYGPIGTRETKPLIPTSIYAITKRDHEEMCLVVGNAYGIPTVALRFFNVYGPGQSLSNPYTGVAAIFASRLLNGRPPVIFEDGRQSRDFIHVSDIVQGILRALESDAAVGQALNLGTGRASTVDEVADAPLAGNRRRRRARADRPLPGRRHPALLRRYDVAPRASSGFARSVAARGRNA